MKYYLEQEVKGTSLDSAIEKVTEALKESGFGIITTIDMKATLKNKINVDFKPYTILGACNPKFAHQALLNEENIGVFLPCNVIVKQTDSGYAAVAVDPVASMLAVENNNLHAFANEIKNMLSDAMSKL